MLTEKNIKINAKSEGSSFEKAFIELGRSSSIHISSNNSSAEENNDYVHLEVSCFAGNNPRVYIVIGLHIDKYKKVVSDEGEQLSTNDMTSYTNFGNGDRYYELSYGAYLAVGILRSSSSSISLLFFYAKHGAFVVLDEDRSSFLIACFPEQFILEPKKYEALVLLDRQGKQVLIDIQHEQQSFQVETINQITVIPEFNKLPVVNDVLEILNKDHNIVENLSPKHYVVHEPVFAKVNTAEEVAFISIEIKRIREKELNKSIKNTEHLPTLTGSVKQINLAIKIRVDFYSNNPSSPKLSQTATAQYWIRIRYKFSS